MPVWKRLVRLGLASGVLFLCGSATGRLVAAPRGVMLQPAVEEKAPEADDTRKATDAEYKAVTTAIEEVDIRSHNLGSRALDAVFLPTLGLQTSDYQYLTTFR